ncbi:MAG: hypothetical protein ACNA8S_15780 [Deferrisomatales bacterium]
MTEPTGNWEAQTRKPCGACGCGVHVMPHLASGLSLSCVNRSCGCSSQVGHDAAEARRQFDAEALKRQEVAAQA